MKKSAFIFVLLFLFPRSKAQERLGITNSNYYSTASIHLNPSSSVDSRTYAQFHLVGLNAFAKTNLAYLPKFNIRQAANISNLTPTTSKNKKFLYVNASGEGPALVFNKRTYGVGFFLRARAVVDARRVSYELASALLNGQILPSENSRALMGQDFKNAKLSSMSWAEYGINLGKMVLRDRHRLITAGVNLKYLTGINIVYANIKKFDSYDNDNGSFGINTLDAKILYNMPRWRAGRGFGMDLGVTYKEMEDYVDKYYAHSVVSRCDYVDYKYKIGLSLRDVGFVKFKGSTTRTLVNGSGHFDPYRKDTAFVEAIQYNFSSTTETDRSILACLPTALSGQLDYNFDNWIYLNLTVIKNLVPTRITGVQSPDLWSVCPRFEMRQVEVAVPLTFQKFIHPQLGLGLRYRSFVIGTDNIVPFVIRSNTYGLNVYFSLAVSLFKNPACKTKRAGVSDCPTYRKTGKNRPKRRKNFSSRNKN